MHKFTPPVRRPQAKVSPDAQVVFGKAQETGSLPQLQKGFLPEGIHDATLSAVEQLFVNTLTRELLWRRLSDFFSWVSLTNNFACAYLGGSFISNDPSPNDVEVILQTKASYGPDSFLAMEPFFACGLKQIYQQYRVHLSFFMNDLPAGCEDFQGAFECRNPRNTAHARLGRRSKHGIVKITFEPINRASSRR